MRLPGVLGEFFKAFLSELADATRDAPDSAAPGFARYVCLILESWGRYRLGAPLVRPLLLGAAAPSADFALHLAQPDIAGLFIALRVFFTDERLLCC